MNDANEPTTVPLYQRLSDRSGESASTEWMRPRPAPPQPMFEALAAARALDLDSDPRVREQLDQARREAEIAGRADGEKQAAELCAKLAESIQFLDQAASRGLDMIAAEIVELAMVVAEEIVRHEIGLDSERLAALVRDGISSLADDTEISVRLHPDEIDAVRGARPSLEDSVRLIADASLSRGGCVLESSDRVVDARIEARLESVREGLVSLLDSRDGPESLC